MASDTDDEKDEGSTAEEDGDEEEDQDENKKPGRRTRTVRKDGTTVVDLAAVKRCFKVCLGPKVKDEKILNFLQSLDAHLPADLRTQPNGRTMGQHFAEWSRLLESGQFNILVRILWGIYIREWVRKSKFLEVKIHRKLRHPWFRSTVHCLTIEYSSKNQV